MGLLMPYSYIRAEWRRCRVPLLFLRLDNLVFKRHRFAKLVPRQKS